MVYVANMKKGLFVLLAALAAEASAQTGVLRDYIDEYGINHGKGIVIAEVAWAPVNCGYHETMYPYGKLYQWGRKTGQGYGCPDSRENPKGVAEYADTKGAWVRFVEEPPVSVAAGQSKECADTFFYCDNRHHWFNWIDDDVVKWNAGNPYDPAKNQPDDPCPKGWRVPTPEELQWLTKNHPVYGAADFEQYDKDEKGRYGVWFSGFEPYSENVPRLFLLLAGMREYSGAHSLDREAAGHYWGSCYGYKVEFSRRAKVIEHSDAYPAEGCSVRCVQEDY